MALVFLDANILFDIFEERRDVNLRELTKNHLFCSPLSIHIYNYLYKRKMPEEKIIKILERLEVEFVPMSGDIVFQALKGPTKDFEDNVQLYSAVECECDYFLTNDKPLWDGMKFFGKVKIVPEVPVESR